MIGHALHRNIVPGSGPIRPGVFRICSIRIPVQRLLAEIQNLFKSRWFAHVIIKISKLIFVIHIQRAGFSLLCIRAAEKRPGFLFPGNIPVRLFRIVLHVPAFPSCAPDILNLVPRFRR